MNSSANLDISSDEDLDKSDWLTLTSSDSDIDDDKLKNNSKILNKKKNSTTTNNNIVILDDDEKLYYENKINENYKYGLVMNLYNDTDTDTENDYNNSMNNSNIISIHQLLQQE